MIFNLVKHAKQLLFDNSKSKLSATNTQDAIDELKGRIDAKVTNSFTGGRALFSNADGKIASSSTVTSTELGYLDGVTSNIQTQLNDKLNKGGHAVNKAVVTDGNGNIAPTGITSAEIGTLRGVTSNIQTQLNGKLPLAGGTMTGNITTQSILPQKATASVCGTADKPYLTMSAKGHYLYDSTLKDCGSFAVQVDGTSQQIGYATLTLGNNLVSGTAGNSRGRVLLYNPKGVYTYIDTNDNATVSNRLVLPTASGIIPVVSVSGTTLNINF